MTNEYGFIVRKVKDWTFDKNGMADKQFDTGNWSVCLPHQCDEWLIAGDWSKGCSREEAIEKLSKFIDEAQTLLCILKPKRRGTHKNDSPQTPKDPRLA